MYIYIYIFFVLAKSTGLENTTPTTPKGRLY